MAVPRDSKWDTERHERLLLELRHASRSDLQIA